MSGNNTTTMDQLIRSELWSNELKETLMDSLEAQKYVKWMSEFPDGTTFTIPSIGQSSVQDITEDEPITFEAMDTGEFQFTITEYIGSATYITRKAAQDSFYTQELVSSFVPSQARAIDEHVETTIFALQSGQTASDLNNINGFPHRFVASGSSAVMEVQNFAKAKLSLKKANVPMMNLIAVVDPTVGYQLETATNLVNVSNNPRWEGIIESGLTTGMRFVKNVYGFDVYESNYLANPGTETVDSVTATTNVAANMFFSVSSEALPFIGAWRQMPTVDTKFEMETQRDKFMTTARYGVKLYRPEGLVVVLTQTDQT